MADGLRADPNAPAAEMDWDAAGRILADAAKGADDGEIFVEDSRAESFYWDDGRLKSASFDATQGFGLRVVAGERAGYGHASVLDTEAIGRAAEAASGEDSLARLDEHAERFANGALASEREGLTIVRLCELGRVDEARPRIEAFAQAHASSLMHARIEKACSK